MKNDWWSALRCSSFGAFVLTCTLATRALAQTNFSETVVTLRASDASASESGDAGQFVITREGVTNYSLAVFYHIGGSASNGVDYAQIPSGVSIPAGSTRVEIPIHPINDSHVEGDETVELQLVPSPLACPSPQCGYAIGSPSNGVVVIHDNDFNSTNNPPPTVRITTPTNGATFYTHVECPPCLTNNPPCALPCYQVGPNITICATASDLNGYVATVEFFAGTNSLGIRTNSCPACAGPANPFCLVWSNVPPGSYVLSALATDNLGAKGHSDPANITVRESPPQTNLPVVTVFATDGSATEPCTNSTASNFVDAGRFTVHRTAGTNNSLTVYYAVGGTASNGVDYTSLPGSITIPAGRYEADIYVYPIADSLAEGTESVVLHLQQVACVAIYPPPPGCYAVGTPSEAAVQIHDCEPRVTNAPPRVVITTPTNGAVFVAPANIAIASDTVDADGYVTRVEFFANDHKIGEDFKLFFTPPTNGTHIDYGMVWTNPPPGLYSLRARATDNVGGTAYSESVRISVTGTNPPPPTNFPPVVTISAIDSIAAEGTNIWRYYTNSTIGPTDPYRTNYCGTNTATFLVRRGGSTNASLTAYYAIGGSASNGVDYAALPGVVTIPAGERSARIVVDPVDDTIPECTESVILKLLVPSNSPPDYTIGWPGKAGAIIVDNDAPPPNTTVLCDGVFHLCVPATNNFTYRLECSLDMVHWVPVCTNTVTEMNIHFAEPETTDFPTRFYRVLPESNPSPP